MTIKNKLLVLILMVTACLLGVYLYLKSNNHSNTAVSDIPSSSSSINNVAKPIINNTNDFALFRIETNQGPIYVNPKGEVVIYPDEATLIPKELKIIVSDLVPFLQNGDWGFMNKNGKVVVEPRFSYAQNPLYDDIKTTAYKNNQKFYVSMKGIVESIKVSWPKFQANQPLPIIERIGPLNNNRSLIGFVSDYGVKFGFIDASGNVVIEPNFDRVGKFSNGFAPVLNKNGTCGYININGEFSLSFNCSELSSINKDGIAIIKQRNANNQYINVVIDSNGNKLFEYLGELITNCCNDNRIAFMNQKIGFYDYSGKVAIPPQYDQTTGFAYGFALVTKNNIPAIIDPAGKQVWIYDEASVNSKLNAYFDAKDKLASENIADENSMPLMSGKDTYNTSCLLCHGTGALKAPKLGDMGVWKPLLDKGLETLTSNAINGIGQMPARGGNAGLRDEEVSAAVKYMANESGGNFYN